MILGHYEQGDTLDLIHGYHPASVSVLKECPFLIILGADMAFTSCHECLAFESVVPTTHRENSHRCSSLEYHVLQNDIQNGVGIIQPQSAIMIRTQLL